MVAGPTHFLPERGQCSGGCELSFRVNGVWGLAGTCSPALEAARLWLWYLSHGCPLSGPLTQPGGGTEADQSRLDPGGLRRVCVCVCVCVSMSLRRLYHLYLSEQLLSTCSYVCRSRGLEVLRQQGYDIYKAR